MKKLSHLKKGQIVKAQIIEVVANQEFIASFQGQLVRLKNTSIKKVQQGEVIELQVAQNHPLRFTLPSKGGLNLSV